jgi:hypothetical protein
VSTRLTVWVIVLAVAAIMGLVGAIIQHFRRRRLKTTMADLGFFPTTKHDDLMRDLIGFHFFRRGQRQSYSSIHKASLNNLEVIALDYAFDRTGEEEMVRQTVIGFRAPELALPFVARDEPDGFSYQCKDDLVFFFMEGQLVSPKNYESFLKRCLVMLEQIRRDPPEPIRTPVNLGKRSAPKKIVRRKPAKE